MDVAMLVNHRMQMKESKKLETYQDFCLKATKIWNMEVRVIFIRVDTFETMPKYIKGRIGWARNSKKSLNCPDYDVDGVCEDTEIRVANFEGILKQIGLC